MTFAGFGREALPFFKALAFHQSREWFEANRGAYESAIRGPMGDLVEDVAERLRQAKIPIKGDRKSVLFRIHRDVRFSANKDPYKTHAGAVMTRSGNKNDPGLLYFHLSPEECFFAAGFYLPDPDKLARLRAAAARAPKPFKAMTAKLRKSGLALSAEDSLKRAARLRGGRRSRGRGRGAAQEHGLHAPGRRGGDRLSDAGWRILRLRRQHPAVAQMGLGRHRRFALAVKTMLSPPSFPKSANARSQVRRVRRWRK
jgi:uncharacterized protein (TIGR02453 family)